ncbi:recombination-associated protein RdgC [Larsenimonas salina]|uniref:recombination-associated protein RdgC n=1 Tax=Larsenimonas salina TaxID=1295565 RepID=UPI002072D2A7|nr:recombination-associated protein RdgC [Larsenimonas salina]MCM5703178.1 recombination-associated protein RdgC [Larsenimonas salina]
MWFKHLHLYRLHDEQVIDLESLDDALSTQAFRPVGPFEAKRVGWQSPGGRLDPSLVRDIEGHRLLTMGCQERLLPSSVIKEVLEERCLEQEAEQGFPVTRRDKQALKEKLTEELLPQAFTRSTRVDIWWDTRNRLIGVHCASQKRAEEALDLLRQSLGSLKVAPISVAVPPGRTMTGWLNDPTTRPDTLLLGDQIELRAANEDEGVLRGRQVDLECDEIQAALSAGRRVSQLGLIADGQMRFTLHEDLAIKSIRFDDALTEEADESLSDEDPLLKLDTEFSLMAHTLSATLSQLIEWLGGETQFTTSEP